MLDGTFMNNLIPVQKTPFWCLHEASITHLEDKFMFCIYILYLWNFLNFFTLSNNGSKKKLLARQTILYFENNSLQ
jgi:hypothetical protein